MKKQDEICVVTEILSNNSTMVHINNATFNVNMNSVLLAVIIFLIIIILTLVILCFSPELRSYFIQLLLNVVKQS